MIYRTLDENTNEQMTPLVRKRCHSRKCVFEDENRELMVFFNAMDEVFFSVDMVTRKVIQISPACEKTLRI